LREGAVANVTLDRSGARGRGPGLPVELPEVVNPLLSSFAARSILLL
jgi:hypothetical protein